MSSSWNGNSGNWSDPAQWAGGVPGPGDYAQFNATGNYLVTYGTIDQVQQVYGSDTGATFDVTSGTLDTSSWTWDGTYLQSGGTLDVTAVYPQWLGTVALSGGELILTNQNGYSGFFQDGVDQTGGTIDITSGELYMLGSLSTLNGELTGAGGFIVGGQSGIVVTLGTDVALDTGNIGLLHGGDLVLTAPVTGTQTYLYEGDLTAGDSSTLDSEGQVFALGAEGNGSFGGTFTGGGSLVVEGDYNLGGMDVAGIGSTVFIDGTAIQDNTPVTLGPSATDQAGLVIGNSGTYDLVANGQITGNTFSSIVVLGTLEANFPAQEGPAIADVEDFTLASRGALAIAGALELEGQNSHATALLAGTVTGPGTLEISYNEIASVGSTALDMGYLLINGYSPPYGELLLTADQVYNGTLLAGDGEIDTNGFVFTLGGRGTLSNVVNGGGTVLAAGNLELFSPTLTGTGTELDISGQGNAGELSGAGYIYLGETTADNTTLSILAGAPPGGFNVQGGDAGPSGTLNLSIGGGVVGTGTAVVNNAGLIELTDGSPYSGAGPEFYHVTFTNTGTVDIQIGVLELFGGTAALGGLVEGPGTLWLDGDTVTMLAGLTLDVGNLLWIGAQITLGGNLSYDGLLLEGNNSTINTEGYTLSLATGALDGVITGGGTIITQGNIDNGPGGLTGNLWLEGTGTTLLDEYSITQDNGDLALGERASDSATLDIASGASYIIAGDLHGIISESTIGSLIDNNGLFEDNIIYPLGPNTTVGVGTFINHGTVADSAGALEFISSFVNDGFVSVSQEVLISGAVTADAGDAGTFVIGNGAELGFSGAFLPNPVATSLVAASQTISFATDSGLLVLGAGESFAGTIEGFTVGDQIDIRDFQSNLMSYGNGQLTLFSVIETSTNPDGYLTTALGTLNLPGIDAGDLRLFYDEANGGIDIVMSDSETAQAPFFESNVYSSTWIGPSGDNWNTAADWDTEYYLPSAATNPQITMAVPPEDYAIIFPSSASAYDVNFDQDYTANTLEGLQGSTLNISGGTLQALYQLEDLGAVNISGGTLESVDAAAGGNNVIGLLSGFSLGAGGVLQIDNGGVGISNYTGESLHFIGGTIDGAGLLELETGTFSIAGSADLAVATLVAAANDVLLEANQVFYGQLLVNSGSINLNANDLLVQAGSTLDLASSSDLYGGGTVTVAGMAYLDGAIKGAGTEILITGTAQTAYSPVALGEYIGNSASSSIIVAQSGTFFNPYFVDSGELYSDTLINNGFIDQTSPTTPTDPLNRQEELQLFVNNQGATLDIAAGIMDFDFGTAILSGLIEGNGTLDLQAETTTLDGSAALDISNVELDDATLDLQTSYYYDGDFYFDGGDINLNGGTFQLGGENDADQDNSTGELYGLISGGGQIQVDGDYYATGLTLSGTGTSLIDYGYMAVGSGGIEDGVLNSDSTVFSIAGSGTLDFQGPDNSVSDGGGASTFINSGLLLLSETGNNILEVATFISTGVIDLPYSQLEIVAASGTIGGFVTGAGELYLNTTGTITLEPTVTLDVGAMEFQDGVFQLAGNVTYAGHLNEFNPTLDTNGFGLDLAAGSTGTLAGYFIGDGAVTIGGDFFDTATELWAAGTTLDVSGTLYGLSSVYMGSTNASGPGVLLTVENTGTVDIEQDGFIGAIGSFSNFTIVNAGLFEKTGSTGTTDITGGTFINTGTLAADTGTLDVTSTLINDGTLFEDGFGVLQVAGSIGGSGVIIIDPAAVTLSGAIAAGQSIEFTGPGGDLLLADSAQFLGTITGFAAGDVIDLTNIATAAITGESFANGVLTLDDGAGNINIAFADPSSFAPVLSIGADGASGTEITEVTCFAAGTRIATARGEVAVENLQIGDQVRTRDAGLQPIKWIGWRSYAAPFANHVKVLPVCIRAGAIADNVPARDLFVSPGHAMHIDGLLIHAALLVNGVSITQVKSVEQVKYFHIELENHEIIFAENCEAETFRGEQFRNQFHNAAEFFARYPGEAPAQEPCRAQPEQGFALHAVLQRLARRAGLAERVRTGTLRGYVDQSGPLRVSGWAQDTASPQTPVSLDILCNGQRIGRVLANRNRADLRDAGFGSGCHGFEFPLPFAVYPGEIEIRHSATGAALRKTAAAAA